MTNEKINEMWKEIMKLTIGGEKSTRYMMEFLSEDERLEIRKEYLQWCENYSKTSTGGWSACMSYEYSKEAQRDIIEKHVKESVVELSVDGRNALMKKVMDMAEKLLARFGLDMPAIKWQTYNVSTVKKDRLTLNALDFVYRGANETEDTVIERCMNLFCCYVYFYGEGVKEYFDAHGLTYTKRTGKGYDAWKKMVLDKMKKKETKAKEKKEEGEKTKEKITVKKVSITNNIATCYAELEERVLMHDHIDVGVKDFWCKQTTRFRVDFELHDGGDTVVPTTVRVAGQLPYSFLCTGKYTTNCGKLDENKNWTWYDVTYEKNLDYGDKVENYQIGYLEDVSHKVIEKMLKAIEHPKRYDKAYDCAGLLDDISK